MRSSAGTEPERKAKGVKRLKELEQLASHLSYHEKYQIEMRFNGNEYELTWKLQADDLVDRNLTPQTKAFIRLGLPPFATMMDALADIQSE